MPSPKKLSYPDTYLPATNKELEDASAKLRKLHAAKSSCANCKFSLHSKQWLLCSLKDKRIQISALLLQKIREHSDMEFKSCYKPFVGKKLEDIANEIEK